MRAKRTFIGIAFALLVASPLRAPRLLAFPYEAQVGADRVYSSVPLKPTALAAILGRANRLAAASPLASGTEGREIYLTDGDWRWKWLAATSGGAFAFTRAFSNAVIVNRADLAGDRVFNGAAMGGERPLSSVIAHEKCHGMVRRHFGVVREQTAPLWLREGYCDYVAGGSSLTDAQADQLEASGSRHPALPYVRGRQKVAALLAANGGSVDQLFDNPQ